jgi:hypothetical protein
VGLVGAATTRASTTPQVIIAIIGMATAVVMAPAAGSLARLPLTRRHH